jgi:glutamate formiminotransferase / 5-formyltetrahydrofolate cyclo-ligase
VSGNVVVGVVPNFSEGRRADVIDAIVRALHVPGARVVYAEADPDHHRLDTTVLGSPPVVMRSAFAAARVAVDLIDLEHHSGGHPRMGAVDVVPFMPVRNISMAGCVTLAKDFGRMLAESLDIPVYLYDEAAASPDRRSLADVRRGEFEGLREAVAKGERLPDLGPHALGPAGATAVGARKPLVAFNVYLDGTDEAAAKAIAASIRESGGGLPAVRAIGFAVPERGGIVTVSMNLVDHEVTPPGAAFDEVVRLAAEQGMTITDAEIVGLVPAAALRAGDEDRLKLRGFDPATQVLERLLDTTDEGG